MMIYTRNIYGKENLRRVFNLNHFREIRVITDGRDEIAETIGAKNIPDNFTFLSAYGDSGFSILDVNRIEFLNGLLDDFMQAVFNGDKVYDINNYYMRAESKAGLAGKSSLESWLEEQLIKNENVRLDVLKFIWNFITLDKNPESFRVIEHQFTMGYCYHFALIMKKMFGVKVIGIFFGRIGTQLYMIYVEFTVTIIVVKSFLYLNWEMK